VGEFSFILAGLGIALGLLPTDAVIGERRDRRRRNEPGRQRCRARYPADHNPLHHRSGVIGRWLR